MGGHGSGRPLFSGRNGRDTTESQHRVDIRWLKQQGRLRPHAFGSLSWSSGGKETGSIGYAMEKDRMVLKYQIGADKEQIEQTVCFDRTPCHFGGYRQWFLCPGCGKRVALLYGAGKYFLCRHCYDLTYSCKQEQPVDRYMRKARRIRSRLGASDNLGEPIWQKPKGMHWRTFERLKNKADTANECSWRIMGRRFGLC